MDFNPSRQPKNLLEHDSPFEFFEMPTLQPVKKKWRFQWRFSFDAPRVRGFLKQYRWALLALSVAIAAMMVLSSGPAAKAPFVFIEVRAIDPSGHPVAGARVALGKDIRGVTDSFGEWRRYLRLQPGADVLVQIKKNTRYGVFTAERSLKVPLKIPKNKEPEIRAAIQLQPEKIKRVTGQVAADKRQPVEDTMGLAEGEQAQEASAPQNPAAIPPALKDVKQGFDFQRVALVLKLAQNIGNNTLAKQQKAYLEKKVFPLLQDVLQKDGIKLDPASPWQVAIQFVAFPDKTPAAKVDVHWGVGEHQGLSFLRQLTNNPQETAQLIAQQVKAHTPKSYAAYRQNGSWYVHQNETAKGYWALQGGEVLRDPEGQAFPVTKEMVNDQQSRMRLITADEKPCSGSQESCVLITPTLRETAPIAGWRWLKVKIIGNIPKGSHIYLSGFQARRVNGNVWEYWGEPGTGANLTMVKGDRIVMRRRIQDSEVQVPTISLQETQVARR